MEGWTWCTPKYRGVHFWVFTFLYDTDNRSQLKCKPSQPLPSWQQWHVQLWQRDTTCPVPSKQKNKMVFKDCRAAFLLLTEHFYKEERRDPGHLGISPSKLTSVFFPEACRWAGCFLRTPSNSSNSFRAIWAILPTLSTWTFPGGLQGLCAFQHRHQHSFSSPPAPLASSLVGKN